MMRIKWDKVQWNVYFYPWQRSANIFIPLSHFCSSLSIVLAPLSFHLPLLWWSCLQVLLGLILILCASPSLPLSCPDWWIFCRLALFHLDCAPSMGCPALHMKGAYMCPFSRTFLRPQMVYLFSVYHSFTSTDLIILHPLTFCSLIFNMRVIIFKCIL